MCNHNTPSPPRAGSRRRRVWELPSHSLCPVIGVCLSIQALQRIVGKALGGAPIADDYDLHCGVIAECRERTPVSERVQRELDRRYELAVRAAATAKSTEALTAWWQTRRNGSEVAGALWATLSHPRCDSALDELVLRDIHMLQHQLGSANRASVQRLNELVEENAVIAQELAAVQRRATQASAQQRVKIEQLQAQIVQLRALLMRRETEIAVLAEDLQALEAAVPGLRQRVELAQSMERQTSRIHDLERALMRSQHEAERATARAQEAEQALQEQRCVQEQAGDEPPVASVPRLDRQAVLCVGGRQASVPVYRELIENVGGRFLHHDGGEEDSAVQLDASLERADLVICQTGCISHDAYWRVKDHCKRTGKRCVFVEKPSRAGLQRALSALGGHRVVIPVVRDTAPE